MSSPLKSATHLLNWLLQRMGPSRQASGVVLTCEPCCSIGGARTAAAAAAAAPHNSGFAWRPCAETGTDSELGSGSGEECMQAAAVGEWSAVHTVAARHKSLKRRAAEALLAARYCEGTSRPCPQQTYNSSCLQPASFSQRGFAAAATAHSGGTKPASTTDQEAGDSSLSDMDQFAAIHTPVTQPGTKGPGTSHRGSSAANTTSRAGSNVMPAVRPLQSLAVCPQPRPAQPAQLSQPQLPRRMRSKALSASRQSPDTQSAPADAAAAGGQQPATKRARVAPSGEPSPTPSQQRQQQQQQAPAPPESAAWYDLWLERSKVEAQQQPPAASPPPQPEQSSPSPSPSPPPSVSPAPSARSPSSLQRVKQPAGDGLQRPQPPSRQAQGAQPGGPTAAGPAGSAGAPGQRLPKPHGPLLPDATPSEGARPVKRCPPSCSCSQSGWCQFPVSVPPVDWQHVFTSDPSSYTMRNLGAGYEVFFLPQGLKVLHVSDAKWAMDAVSQLRASMQDPVLAIDLEWKPDRGGPVNKVAVMQVASATTCVLFHTSAMHFKLPAAVRALMADPQIHMVGFAWDGSDEKKMIGSFGCGKADFGNFHDLEVVAKQLGWQGPGLGLDRFTRHVLGFGLNKSKSVSRSNWASRKLTIAQVKYAALDAFSTGQVFRGLRLWHSDPAPCPGCKVPLGAPLMSLQMVCSDTGRVFLDYKAYLAHCAKTIQTSMVTKCEACGRTVSSSSTTTTTTATPSAAGTVVTTTTTDTAMAAVSQQQQW